MRYSLILLLAISFASIATDNFGAWATTCNDDGFYFPFDNKTSPLVVNDNQIVVSVHSIIKENVVNVYLDGPLDLGRGGMNIKWDDIDKSKKIAEMEYKNKSGHLKWFGFFDKKKNTYFWHENPDFVQSHSNGGVVNMTRCD